MERMFCYYHKKTFAIDKCSQCGHPLCRSCQTIVKGNILCVRCSTLTIAGVTFTPERSPFFAALLSFLFPGAGQVYNGEPGKGYFILFTSWLLFPWVYGIVDAVVVARQINFHRVATRPSMTRFLTFITVALVLYFGVFQAARSLPRVDLSSRRTEASLRVLSDALEDYARTHGEYPENFSRLYASTSTPLDALMCDGLAYGYSLTCAFSEDGYDIVASPVEDGPRGESTLTVSTGGILTSRSALSP